MGLYISIGFVAGKLELTVTLEITLSVQPIPNALLCSERRLFDTVT